MPPAPALSRREREVMDILYARERATVAEIITEMPEPPSYSAVRALLATLEQKGHVRHQKRGAKYVYIPCVPPAAAKRSAVRHLLRTFFGGSRELAVAAILDTGSSDLSDEELDRLLAQMRARKERKR